MRGDAKIVARKYRCGRKMNRPTNRLFIVFYSAIDFFIDAHLGGYVIQAMGVDSILGWRYTARHFLHRFSYNTPPINPSPKCGVVMRYVVKCLLMVNVKVVASSDSISVILSQMWKNGGLRYISANLAFNSSAWTGCARFMR